MRICRTLLGMLALAGGIFLSSARAQAQTTYSVDCAAAGGDGLSWGQAFPDLQDALAAAVDGDQIWVAACSLPPNADRPVEPPQPPAPPQRAYSIQRASGVVN